MAQKTKVKKETKTIEEYIGFEKLEGLASLLDDLMESKDKDYDKTLEKLVKKVGFIEICQLIHTAYMASILLIPLMEFRNAVESKTKNKMQAPDFDADLKRFMEITKTNASVKVEGGDMSDGINRSGKVH